MSAPGPGFPRRDEADLGHQVPDSRFVESKARSEGTVDRVFAAMLTNMMGMGRQPICKVNAQPNGAQAAEGERRSARVGTSVQGRGRRLGQARHRKICTDGQQRSPPLLGCRFEQGLDIDIERAEPDA